MKMNVNDEFYKQGYENAIKEIYQLAYDFECCPYCGRVDIESHFCPYCKERIVTLYDGGWFAEYLKKKYKLKE